MPDGRGRPVIDVSPRWQGQYRRLRTLVEVRWDRCTVRTTTKESRHSKNFVSNLVRVTMPKI